MELATKIGFHGYFEYRIRPLGWEPYGEDPMMERATVYIKDPHNPDLGKLIKAKIFFASNIFMLSCIIVNYPAYWLHVQVSMVNKVYMKSC